MQEGQWEIFHSENLNIYKPCICGHRVKRISYLYDRISKTTIYIGTTCLKKYGITNHLKNRILIEVLKENPMDICDLEENVRTWIQKTYSAFRNKVDECCQGVFDYYDIIAPFRRLLNDVCELVTEYDFKLILLLKEIERDVESMNETTKHFMIDEFDSDCDLSDNTSISTIPSELSDEIYIFSAETPVDSEYDNDDIYSIASSEFSVDETPYDTLSDRSSAPERGILNEIWCKRIGNWDKPRPIAIADPFCDDPNCNPHMHYYCNIKFRLHHLRKNIAEHHEQINTIRIEFENVVKNSVQYRSQIQQHNVSTLDFIAECKRKIRGNNIIDS
jgi:hypothetical protein